MWFERVEFSFLGLKNPNISNILGINDVRICLLLLLATLAFPNAILTEIYKTPLIKILWIFYSLRSNFRFEKKLQICNLEGHQTSLLLFLMQKSVVRPLNLDKFSS